MQETSALYKSILAGTHWYEISVVDGENGRLINERSNVITFGGTAILVSRGGGDSGYFETKLRSVKTTRSQFGGTMPEVGCAIAGEIDVEMIKPAGEFPRQAVITPYVRITNGTDTSEWLQKGVFFIDTRSTDDDDYSQPILKIHGYDAMMRAEADYTGANLAWPATDIAVVNDIAALMGVSVDSRTVETMTQAYPIQLPSGYSQREVLGYIAAMYGGNFVMSDFGELLLVKLNSLPAETNLLINRDGYYITFGGDRIAV